MDFSPFCMQLFPLTGLGVSEGKRQVGINCGK